MKKSVKILAGITAFVLIGGILWFASGILGNPISKVLANNTAKKYIDKNYSHMNLNISEVSYNFKDGNYQDTYFTVIISTLGKIQYDSYEDDVTSKNNIYKRINDEYDEKVEEVFEDKSFPYKGNICFGELKEITSKELDDEYTDFGVEYGIDKSKLELDKNY